MENESFSQLVWLFTQAPALAAFLFAVKAISVMFSKNYSKKRVIKYFTYAVACAAIWALLQLIINLVG